MTPVNILIVSDAPKETVLPVLAAAGLHPAILNGGEVALPGPQAQATPQVASEDSMRIAYLEAKLKALYAEQASRNLADENARLRQRIDELLTHKQTMGETIEDMRQQLDSHTRRPILTAKRKPKKRKVKKVAGPKATKKPPLHNRTPSMNRAA